MAVKDQTIQDDYAIYNGDCIEVMQSMPKECLHLSVYSPPFGGLYNYSSSEKDLSNCSDYTQFFEHYAFVVRELVRLTLPGRMTAVHCMDVPSGNSGTDCLIDFPGVPFMGIGSEVYAAVQMGRKGIGMELKSSYYRQAVKNVAAAAKRELEIQAGLEFSGEQAAESDEEAA